jgi:hypothetical protein
MPVINLTHVPLLGPVATGIVWTNLPNALAEFPGPVPPTRTKWDLTSFDVCRVLANVSVAAANGTVIGVQGSVDAAAWTTLCSVTINNATGLQVGAVATLPPAVKAAGDVFLRVAGQGGNGTADPAFLSIAAQFAAQPTFGVGGLGGQILDNLFGLVRNVRQNAADYKVRVAAGQPIAGIAAVMVADADQYLVRCGWLTTAANADPTLFAAALAVRGFTLDQATALRDTIIAAANHTKAAALTTANEVNTEADWLLANVPAYSFLW